MVLLSVQKASPARGADTFVRRFRYTVVEARTRIRRPKSLCSYYVKFRMQRDVK